MRASSPTLLELLDDSQRQRGIRLPAHFGTAIYGDSGRAAAEEERVELIDFLYLCVFEGGLGLVRRSDALKSPAEDAWQVRGGKDTWSAGQNQQDMI